MSQPKNFNKLNSVILMVGNKKRKKKEVEWEEEAQSQSRKQMKQND